LQIVRGCATTTTAATPPRGDRRLAGRRGRRRGAPPAAGRRRRRPADDASCPGRLGRTALGRPHRPFVSPRPQAAAFDGADYLGVGPCFPRPTKDFAAVYAAEFLAAVGGQIGLPTFAIGGITLDRLEAIAACGLRRVAVACGRDGGS